MTGKNSGKEWHPRFTELNDGWIDVFCDGCPAVHCVGQCDTDPGWVECATGVDAEPWNEECIRHDRYREIDEHQRDIDELIFGEAV